MPRLSTRLRIVIGLASVLLSTMLTAVVLQIAPDPREAEVIGRSRLCEALAVNTSVLVSRDDMRRVQAILSVLEVRHDEILSAGVRRNDGTLLIDVGDHSAKWELDQGRLSDDSQIFVPLRNGFQDWGSLEMKFTPLRGNLWFEVTHSSYTRLVIFVIALCSIAWYWFLGRVLEQLSPSKAMPGRVRSALDTLAEGLLVLDRKGRIVLCNHALSQTLGEAPETLVGRDATKLPWVADMFDPKPKACASSGDAKIPSPMTFPWHAVLSGTQPTASATLRLRDGSGKERICQVNCSPVFGTTTQIRGVVCSFEDVTVIESQKVELAYASRAKSEFLANMSHEIRTPMNAILGFTEVLRRGMYDSAEQRTEYLETIHTSGTHLLHLINDILDLSKVESGRMELERTPCSPHQLILDVMNVLRVKAEEKGLTLTAATPGGLPEVIHSDSVRLRQVLTNLMGNAIKFTECGGVKLVARFLSTDDPMIAIDVIDSGVGIPQKSLEKIFEPFTQADASVTRKFGGTGLGLTISKRFIEALGGTVSVASELGCGTTFTIMIPTGAPDAETRIIDLTEVQARQHQARSTTRQRYAFEASRILLVDDGESNRKLIQLILTREGLLVDTATNGEEAVAQATANSYDVIFMDMQMPIMDGYTAAGILRKQGLTIPIVALTANAMKGDEEKCLAAGCSNFLTKPVDLDELMSLLASLLQATTLSIDSPVVSFGISLATRVPSTIEVESDEQSCVEPETATALMIDALDALIQTIDAELSPEPESNSRRIAESTIYNDEPACNAIVSTLPMDDAEFRELVSGFIPKLHSEVEALNRACNRPDCDEIIRLAHWLKGAAGTMGFRVFTEPARALMENAHNADINSFADALAEINDLAERIQVPTAAELV